MIRRFAMASLAMVTLVSAAPYQAVGPDYKPRDLDERGLWMQMEEAERRLQGSNFVIRDPQLNDYVHGVLCKTVGEDPCRGVRLYIMRTPYFNASMAPNGMMQIWSGLLLRVKNEAQLAAVLAHEYTHFRNQHALQGFRDLKSKTATMAWLSFIPFGAIAQLGIAGSLFSFNREMESEADAGSINLLIKAGYDPAEASHVWTQLRAEMDARAVARNQKSRKDKDRGMFATHPPTAERVQVLADLAAKYRTPTSIDLNVEAFRKAMTPYWSQFMDDQIKMNDFGAAEFLLNQLATDGWTSELLVARGDLYRTRGGPTDLKNSIDYYRQALAAPNPPADLYRNVGFALMRSGATSEGQAMLQQYLVRKPDAADRSMIAMMAGESK